MKAPKIIVWIFMVSLLTGMGCDRTGRGKTALEDMTFHFTAPPDSARPWVYWFVMDGNFSREGIKADLEAMKSAGIGGVIFMEVDVGIPKGPVRFMSPEWRALFRYANAEAARLGLVMTMPASPGWTGSGGPWVKPEQSMQKLVMTEMVTHGKDARLIMPSPESVAGVYTDIAVLAFPSPEGHYRIDDIGEKAVFSRGWYSSLRGVKAFIPVHPEYPEPSSDQVIAQDRVIDLTALMDANGRVDWEVPEGSWTVIRLGHTSTGQLTRPAPEPGLGLECDKCDTHALDAHFGHFIGKILDDLGPLAGKSLISLHIDSWEMGPQNWTADFRNEFRQRRGYDAIPFLPVMTGRVVESLAVSERFLWDFRQTILELITEHHAERLAELAHKNGLRLSIEPYDQTPCDDMTYGSRADVPMGEFWWDTFSTWFSCTEAGSIAHSTGKRIVQAEAFTSGDRERWRAHPASLKTLGDWAFCEGINRLVFHRYAHQPWLDRAPGMTMGPYGIHFERTQTWWDLSPAWIMYLTRCQYLLQQGLFVADVCFLSPEASPHVFRPPASATAGTPPDRAGYHFDGITPEILHLMSVEDGKLVLPGGMSYRVLVLPEVETMTPELLRKIAALVAGGATVIGLPPSSSPSLAGFPSCDHEVRRIAAELWGDCDGKEVTENRYGKGRIVWPVCRPGTSDEGNDSSMHPDTSGRYFFVQPGGPYCHFDAVRKVLASMGVPPDFESKGTFRFIHRRVDGGDLYFIANREERGQEAYCSFRITGKRPEIWDPSTGERVHQAVYKQENGRTVMPLYLKPAGSLFVVFRDILRPDPAACGTGALMLNRCGRSILPGTTSVLYEEPAAEPLCGKEGETRLRIWQAGSYDLRTSADDSFHVEINSLPAISIPGPWEVRFQSGRGAPTSILLDTLMDLSVHDIPGVKYFSGTAVYRNRFVWNPAEEASAHSAAHPRKRYFLDLGDVEVMARVVLNGRDLGILWISPFRTEITDELRRGVNDLAVTVANLWPNRLIGDQALPPEQRVAWTTWNPFDRASPLLPSGLIGPVIVKTAVEVRVP